MIGHKLKPILDARFRANPNYSLIPFDRLPEGYKKDLADHARDADFYGLLWPNETDGLTAKTACQDTALLFYTLQQPGPLPGYVRVKFGSNANQAIAELVLDSVLEVAMDSSDEFVSGAQAHVRVFEAKSPQSKDQGHTARLSMCALRYAQCLQVESAGQLSIRLYCYNTIPITSAWRDRLPTTDSVRHYLGIDTGGSLRRHLDRDWISFDHVDGSEGWLYWRSRRNQGYGQSDVSRPRYKLYISARPEALPEALGEVLETFTDERVNSFKIGSGVQGLLRPDKLVAYLENFEDLASVADRLRVRLNGCAAQGVPFTAGVDHEGLISWGIDPPPEPESTHSKFKESWRLWLTNRLATSILNARSSHADIAPLEFALDRLRIDGVDTTNWTPRQTIWEIH